MDKMTNNKALAYVLENCDIPAEVADKLRKIQETVAKKSGKTRKPTERESRNEAIQRAIVEMVYAEPDRLFTINDFENADFIEPEDAMTNQRMASLIRQLLTEYGNGQTGTGELRRVQDKRKVYFAANVNREEG